MSRKCVWCGKPAGVIVRVIIEDEGKESGDIPSCWMCLFATAAKRLARIRKDEKYGS